MKVSVNRGRCLESKPATGGYGATEVFCTRFCAVEDLLDRNLKNGEKVIVRWQEKRQLEIFKGTKVQ